MPVKYYVFTTAGLLAAVPSTTHKQEAADQPTVVQGTVVEATTRQPIAHLLMTVNSYQYSRYRPHIRYRQAVDSVYTDAQGKYELHFASQQDMRYVVSLDPNPHREMYLAPYGFGMLRQYDSLGPSTDPSRRYLKLGTFNLVDFRPYELQVMAVRIHNRNTGYQQLYVGVGPLAGHNLDTTVYVQGRRVPGMDFPRSYALYRGVNAKGGELASTSVALVVQNPAALPPDTVWATLTFVR